MTIPFTETPSIQSTRPEVQCWLEMRPAEYNGLGITRPDIRGPVEPNRRLERQDVESALEGLPLRLESFISRGFASETWLVKTTAEFCSVDLGQTLVAKLTVSKDEDGSEFLAACASVTIPEILSPIYRRRLPENRSLIIFPHLPLGSLKQHMTGVRFEDEQVRRLVRQVGTALSHMNNVDASRIFVHGDIKPENILVRSVEPLDICLTDFDHSLWVLREGTRGHGGMLSRRYAAPECLSGFLSSTSDLWSLGMVALEMLLGRYALHGLSDESIYVRLSTDWELDQDEPADDTWRALLLGLLDRTYATRWRPADIERWLAGDRQTIAKGLARDSRQKSATSPFDISGQPVYTARSLARTLALNWDNGIAALHSNDLETWLRDSLRAPELVSRRQTLLAATDLTDDERLIRFAYFADHALEPRWRDVHLSRGALDQLATEALAGDLAAYQHLLTLRNSNVVESFSSLGIEGPRQLMGDWSAGWQRYEWAWQRLQEAGAPNVRPPDEAAFPALVRLWLSPEERNFLTERIEEQCSAVRVLLRTNWYFALGHDLPALPIEHQWILDSLDRSSLVETLVYARGQDFVEDEFRRPPTVTNEQLMSAVLFSQPVARLTRNLALDYYSREEIALEDTQRRNRRWSSDDWDGFWTRVTAPLGLTLRNLSVRVRQWWQRRRRRASPPTEGAGAPAAEENTVSVSAVRLDLMLPGRATAPIGQVALIRWRLPPNAQPSIHIGHLGLFGRRKTRQRIRRLPFRIRGAAAGVFERASSRRDNVRLPDRGQMVVASFEPGIVWLQFRMPGGPRTRSQILRLGAPTIPLLPITTRLLGARTTLIQVAPDGFLPLSANLRDVVGELIPIDTRLIPVKEHTGKSIRNTHSPRGGFK